MTKEDNIVSSSRDKLCIHSYIHLFNPEIIIVDGIVAKAGAFITNPIEQAINKYCLTDFRSNLTVVISQLGQEAKWLGTQAYVVEKVIESN